MLVLSRRENQSIIINDNIEIKIVNVKQDQVKIGIVAPNDVKVYRKEIYDAIHKENIEAADAMSKINKIEKLKDVLSKKQEEKKE